MKKYIFIILTGIPSIWMISCNGPNPEEELAPEDKDVYVTNFDPEADFSTYKNFYVDDSVVVIHNQQSYQTQKRPEDVAITNTIKEEMVKLGYTEVDSAHKADVGISVAKISTNYTGISYDYGYGNPYGYYDPFYYGGYGYSYPTYYVYQVREGSVIVDMVDLKTVQPDNKFKVVWNGQFIDGLGSLSSPERILNGVRSLFTQSQYLKDGK
jgi:hypothetical protein